MDTPNRSDGCRHKINYIDEINHPIPSKDIIILFYYHLYMFHQRNQGKNRNVTIVSVGGMINPLAIKFKKTEFD